MPTALVSEFFVIGHMPDGQACHMRFLTQIFDPTNPDPAKRVQIIQPDVALDVNSPNQFAQQSRDAIIAAAAALSPPVPLNPADVIQGMFS
jgi:hypothetical protein